MEFTAEVMSSGIRRLIISATIFNPWPPAVSHSTSLNCSPDSCEVANGILKIAEHTDGCNCNRRRRYDKKVHAKSRPTEQRMFSEIVGFRPFWE